MKFELTYFDSLKNREQTIRLTGINEVKASIDDFESVTP